MVHYSEEMLLVFNPKSFLPHNLKLKFILNLLYYKHFILSYLYINNIKKIICTENY
jgi:hypothetical protein